jgi:hypothetical protein
VELAAAEVAQVQQMPPVAALDQQILVVAVVVELQEVVLQVMAEPAVQV